MHKKINTLITRVLILGSFSSFLALSNAQAISISTASDSVIHAVPAAPTSYSPPPPQVTPPSAPAPAPQVAEAPPPVNNEYVLQRAARN